MDLGNIQLNTVFHDSKGWLWLGAQDGIFRFDGQAFMPVEYPEKMERSPVSAFFEWGDQLFVGFSNGKIGYLHHANGKIPVPSGDLEEDKRRAPRLTLWDIEEGLPQARITGFCNDGRGGFWISTYGEGLYVWKDKRLYNYNQADDGLTGNDIYSLTCDPSGRVWAATDGGISICAMAEKGSKTVENLNKSTGLPDEIIAALTTDQYGNIWAGANEKGIFRYNIQEKKIDIATSYWPYGAVTSITIFGDQELWIGTEKSGLVRFDAATGTLLNMPDGNALARTKISSLCKDREGLLWVIADRGLLYSSNVRFGFLPTPFSNIQAIMTDRSGRLWTGCREGLYLRQQLDFISILPKKENVVSLWESPVDGRIWAGTLGNGVFILSPAGKILKHLEEGKTLPNGSILSISGNNTHAWLATLGGVSLINTQTLEHETGVAEQELGTYYVYKVLTDSRGRVWFGTDGKGLVMYDQGRFQAYTEAGGIKLRTIYSITEDHGGNIWFSTDRDGLFRFDGVQFKRYTTANHLHSNAITSLSTDGVGHIVIGYEDGVDILNPARHDHVNFCSPEIGAPKIDVNLNAAWADARGHVWLGNQHGMLRLAAYREPMVDDPQPGITGVSVFLQPINFQNTSVLDYDQNYLQFTFLGLWHTNPDAVRYRYRLEGFDPEWKISKDHTASYPKLPPGQYTFRVQTSEHGNFENVPEASWTFRIRLPFWQQWWFIVLAILVATTLFASYVRAREQRLKREALLKREKVQSQFETLKSQINPHFLFNSFNTLITIIEESPKVAVEYVEHLSDFYRSIMVYRERDLINLGDELELVHTFEFLLKKRYEDGLQLIDKIEGSAGGQVMPLSLQMLVENAVKHNVISSSKPLTIEIFKENGFVVVRNNLQRKIKPEASTHFGLQSLIHRYQLLGEKPVEVEENEQYFTVKIPLL